MIDISRDFLGLECEIIAISIRVDGSSDNHSATIRLCRGLYLNIDPWFMSGGERETQPPLSLLVHSYTLLFTIGSTVCSITGK